MFAVKITFQNGKSRTRNFPTREAAQRFMRSQDRRTIERIEMTTPAGGKRRWMPPDSLLRRMVRNQTRELFR